MKIWCCFICIFTTIHKSKIAIKSRIYSSWLKWQLALHCSWFLTICCSSKHNVVLLTKTLWFPITRRKSFWKHFDYEWQLVLHCHWLLTICCSHNHCKIWICTSIWLFTDNKTIDTSRFCISLVAANFQFAELLSMLANISA